MTCLSRCEQFVCRFNTSEPESGFCSFHCRSLKELRIKFEVAYVRCDATNNRRFKNTKSIFVGLLRSMEKEIRFSFGAFIDIDFCKNDAIGCKKYVTTHKTKMTSLCVQCRWVPLSKIRSNSSWMAFIFNAVAWKSSSRRHTQLLSHSLPPSDWNLLFPCNF